MVCMIFVAGICVFTILLDKSPLSGRRGGPSWLLVGTCCTVFLVETSDFDVPFDMRDQERDQDSDKLCMGLTSPWIVGKQVMITPMSSSSADKYMSWTWSTGTKVVRYACMHG